MNPSKERIREIAERLSRPIPDPYLAAPRPQKTWGGLRPGDRLRSQGASQTVTVTSVSSAGAQLSDGTLLADRDWRDHYAKEPRHGRR